MNLIPRGNTIFAASLAAVITFIIMAVTRPDPHMRFLLPDHSIPQGPLFDRGFEPLDIRSLPLRDAVELLAQKTHIPIRFRVESLKAAGVNLNAPVSIHLANVTAGLALNEILDAAKPNVELDFWEQGDIVEVGTLAEERTILVTRVYDIRDLTQKIADELPAPQGEGANELGSTTAGTAGGISRSEAEAALEKLISDNIASGSWKDNGGNIGYIQCLAGQLIIGQTPHNHELIEALLYQLSKPESLKPPPRGIMMPDYSLHWPTTQ